jgi:small redox-active disulfide protein 2
MNIKILGGGCAKCITLERHTKEALTDLNLEAEVEKVTDHKDILTYNVMSTPGLVIDGQVVSSGRVLSKGQIKKLLQKTGNQ